MQHGRNPFVGETGERNALGLQHHLSRNTLEQPADLRAGEQSLLVVIRKYVGSHYPALLNTLLSTRGFEKRIQIRHAGGIDNAENPSVQCKHRAGRISK